MQEMLIERDAELAQLRADLCVAQSKVQSAQKLRATQPPHSTTGKREASKDATKPENNTPASAAAQTTPLKRTATPPKSQNTPTPAKRAATPPKVARTPSQMQRAATPPKVVRTPSPMQRAATPPKPLRTPSPQKHSVLRSESKSSAASRQSPNHVVVTNGLHRTPSPTVRQAAPNPLCAINDETIKEFIATHKLTSLLRTRPPQPKTNPSPTRRNNSTSRQSPLLVSPPRQRETHGSSHVADSKRHAGTPPRSLVRVPNAELSKCLT